ncbi:OmpA/MotB family protein [Lampropedia aestuarii]|uniref:OmpA/MotB family protein n=1 Tax=Lampropedia aestuarii TaxID=2562762 RepID=UPI00246967E3|nr:OmpA family protein [Lampropedia aestuarii]MDH5859194.1 OmpA family protein [Lampropedia aestuarii]
MKEKPSEWIVISDLMAGVMAVMMLLLVLSIMQKATSEALYEEALAQTRAKQQSPLRTTTEKIATIIQNSSASNLLEMDSVNARLTLRDGVFEKGSACLTAEAIAAVQSVQNQVEIFLKENENSKIFIEGYTDNLPVKNPVLDVMRFCTVYDDNYTLSAARAREARKALVGALNEQEAKRIIVAGYGDSSPLPGVDPADARNRRVEVQLALSQND